MTDNPLFTGPVQTSDGRKAVVLHHRCTDTRIVADVHQESMWLAAEFNIDGEGLGLLGYNLIPIPEVHPHLSGTRTWITWLIPSYEDHAACDFYLPHAFITMTDGDPATLTVRVVGPER